APKTLRESDDKLETVRQLREINPDVIIVAAYGLMLGYNILSMPRLGCINVHLSLLPKYRGAAPVHRCIENGDEVSGVTIMKMDSGMDSGDILMQAEERIRPDDTAGTLHDRLSQLGANLLMKCLPKLQSGLLTPRKQDPREVTFANKLGKGDGLIDWSLPADTLALRVRAFNPWPSCWTTFLPRGEEGAPERLKILSARAESAPEGCGLAPGFVADISKDGVAITAGEGTMLRLLEVRREGSKSVSGPQFVQGLHPVVGQRFAAEA
ncbi:MAG: methionyl-tRNA formyltransferase, partial [Kiritimatiellae bacterium]|nr:methionyl-tRNA formyltransferase [Kiritimatiellia bacterium]